MCNGDKLEKLHRDPAVTRREAGRETLLFYLFPVPGILPAPGKELRNPYRRSAKIATFKSLLNLSRYPALFF